ncbi:hypothetical protein [Caldilinea sp.]|uniref:hypothetical protein n=1 Tax=Caldilinea sp. TaxID=2293560 RepID=UPI001B1FAF63|nr:hypothetical protein [Caldilinea sp.]MBO9394957.1 PD40 domain-containing protein [Caldilinea sp.]
MKRMFSIAGGLLGLLVLVGLAVVLAMTLDQLREGAQPGFQTFQSPIETPTLPPYPPPATPTVVPMPVPPCLFAGQPAPAEPGPPLEAYRFSEPRVVLTHTGAIGIASWLPNGQHLLITRDIPGTNRQFIETFNVRTGELNTYAEREGGSGKPVWLPALKAVAYITLMAEKDQEQPLIYHPELWLSYGDPQQVERLTSDISGALAVEPGGKRLWYFSRSEPDRPQVFDGESRVIQTVPWNVAAWKYPKPELEWAIRYRSPQFIMAWHPDGTQAVLYSQFWTFLLDVQTNQVCELTLGEYTEAMEIPPWPLEAQWSPDGRYLAFITTGHLDLPFERTELTILDMATGERRTLSPGPDIEPGRHYVTDLAWAPDSRYLAVLGIVRMTEMGSEKAGVFIVDASTGEFQRIFPEHDFGGGLWFTQLAWDSTGSQLAVNCPTLEEGRLCIISVESKSIR